MKKTLITALFNLFFFQAVMAQNFDCEMHLPNGTGTLALNGLERGDVIRLDYFNEGLGRMLEGTFTINFFNKLKGNFHASGVFLDGEEEIEAFIQGGSNPDLNQRIFFSLYAQRDHRIEFGFGNPTECIPE